MTGRLAVIGGGIGGLILADMLSVRDEGGEVVLIEAEESCGGLLRSLDCGDFGCFDYGTHIMSESGDEELDQYLTSLLSDDDQRLFRYARRDLAGLYFNGRLQTHTVFADVTTLEPAVREACLGDFFANIRVEQDASAKSALDYLQGRYGRTLTREVGSKIVEKLVGAEPSLVAPMATRLFPMSRMALFGPDLSHQMARTECPGDRIAYVDQHDIPDDLCSPLAAFYPAKRGVHQYVDVLEKRLRQHDVPILTGCTVRSLERGDASTLLLDLSSDDQMVVDHVFWMANPLFLAPLLNVDVQYQTMDRPFTTVLVHFLFDAPLNIGDVYYFYCADPQFRTFRVTNYEAFCPEAGDTGHFALTVELHMRESGGDGGQLEQQALSELVAMGVVGRGTKPLFGTHEVLRHGFPRPTLANQRELARVTQEIQRRTEGSLTMHGVGARPGAFFMVDILRDLFAFLRTYQPSHV